MWLLPLGSLVRRSGFVPRWLGALLLVNGGAYLLLGAILIHEPSLGKDAMRWLMLPYAAGELSIIGWLVVHSWRPLPPAVLVA